MARVQAEGGVERSGQPRRWLLGVMLGGMLCGSAGGAQAQAAPPREAADTTIQWNFQPVEAEAPPPLTAAALQERWAAPFAVQSRGRVPEREARRVVVLRDSATARRVAESQVAAGESAAEVEVRASGGGGGGGPATNTPAAAAATPPSTPGAVAPAAGTGTTSAPTAAAAGAGTTPSPRPSTAAAAGSTTSSTRPSSGAASGARTHRVEYGETWYGIVREYRVTSARLAAANPDVDPERLRAGTVLRIPAAGEAAPAAAPRASQPAGRTHTVTRGDTLFGIARRYGVTPDALRRANRMTDDVVRLGQTLVIPR